MDFLSYKLDLHAKTVWHFYTATQTAKLNLAYLQEFGHFFAQKEYFTARAGLDSYLIKYTVSGCGMLEYGGVSEKVGPGEFFWIDCKNRQHYCTDPSTGHWEVIWVHFNGATINAYYDLFTQSQGGSYVKKLQDGSLIVNLLKVLSARITSSQSILDEDMLDSDIQISVILTKLMAVCLSTVKNENINASLPSVVLEIRNYLAANFDKKITLDFLAEMFHLDRFYLQKLFKRYIGQSPSQYILYLRMNRAKVLMRTTNLTISEIAHAVGIDNISLFSRQFKNIEGMTPLWYKNNWPMF